MPKSRNIIALCCLIFLNACSGDDVLRASVTIDDVADNNSFLKATVVEPYQVVWMATGRYQSDEIHNAGGFSEASFATNGSKGKFIFSIRANLPTSEEETVFTAWLLEKSPTKKNMIKLGELTSNGGNSYILTYEENFSIDSTYDNPHRYSTYLHSLITTDPDRKEILAGDLKVIRSVSWRQLYENEG